RFEGVGSACATDELAALEAIVRCARAAGPELTRASESLAGRAAAPVLATCAQIERWETRAALAAGAAGVVTDAGLVRALAPSLQAAIAGQVCAPRSQWRQIEPPALST